MRMYLHVGTSLLVIKTGFQHHYKAALQWRAPTITLPSYNRHKFNSQDFFGVPLTDPNEDTHSNMPHSHLETRVSTNERRGGGVPQEAEITGWKMARTAVALRTAVFSTSNEEDALAGSERLFGRGEEQQWLSNVTLPNSSWRNHSTRGGATSCSSSSLGYVLGLKCFFVIPVSTITTKKIDKSHAEVQQEWKILTLTFPL